MHAYPRNGWMERSRGVKVGQGGGGCERVHLVKGAVEGKAGRHVDHRQRPSISMHTCMCVYACACMQACVCMHARICMHVCVCEHWSLAGGGGESLLYEAGADACCERAGCERVCAWCRRVHSSPLHASCMPALEPERVVCHQQRVRAQAPTAPDARRTVICLDSGVCSLHRAGGEAQVCIYCNHL